MVPQRTAVRFFCSLQKSKIISAIKLLPEPVGSSIRDPRLVDERRGIKAPGLGKVRRNQRTF